ncbi:MAG: hydroxymethylbilane synthase [Omnitrophica bacterium GWA2_52_12]|nr:MAG: hydroxymethylbilane synthase [Omnitrophica bacterium GWA2_52_12]
MIKLNVKIGTRGSALALYQAELVKARLQIIFPMGNFEIVVIKTTGDTLSTGGVRSGLTKQIFTREIEEALTKGEIDMAVHSAKDLSVPLPEGLKLGAVLEREDARDCLVSAQNKRFRDLEPGARVGTSALRRKTQLLRLNHDLVVQDLHGNVDTRLRKVQEGQYDAIVLAYAGLKRLGLAEHASEIFSEDVFLPAPGQGIIAVQSRTGDESAAEMLHGLNHAPTLQRLLCERAFLKRLGGGCSLPCGIMTELAGEQLKTKGILLAPNGSHFIERSLDDTAGDPEETGAELAEIILEEGGRKIMHEIERMQKGL